MYYVLLNLITEQKKQISMFKVFFFMGLIPSSEMSPAWIMVVIKGSLNNIQLLHT